MGCASSCKIFETFSTTLEWVAINKLSCNQVIHVLDDFLFMAPGRIDCERSLDKFILCCKQIGVRIAAEKTVGPSQRLTFAGIELDTVAMEARLPEDKLAKCKHAIQNLLGRTSTTLRELQVTIGLLNFACLVVVSGRSFLRR